MRAGSRRPAATSRPGQRRPDAGRRAAAAAARRRPLFTGRAVLLGALVLLLALTLAWPLRQYLAGRAELGPAGRRGATQLDQRAAELQAQLERQADPAYVEQQARERLHYVLPGDRLVIVGRRRSRATGDAGAADAAADGRPSAAALVRAA